MEQKFNQTEMRFIADLTAMVLNVIKNSTRSIIGWPSCYHTNR